MNTIFIGIAGGTGSGKTTLTEHLKQHFGDDISVVHHDSYYKYQDRPFEERCKQNYDHPDAFETDLMVEQLKELKAGKAIRCPVYSYADHQRTSETELIQPSKVVIVEGIHALNDMITNAHPEAFKLYISARSDVLFGDRVVFKRTWFRLVRRMVRDYNFRGSSAAETMGMWANVRRGEKLYISPYKNKADYQFDTALPYELPVFNETATQLFQSVPEGIERFDELRQVLPALQLFGVIDHSLIPKEAMIREFIGGGIYEY